MDNQSLLKNRKAFFVPLIVGAVIQMAPVFFINSDILLAICSVLCPVFFVLAERRAESVKELIIFAGAVLLSQFVRFSGIFGSGLFKWFAAFISIALWTLFEMVAFLADHYIIRKTESAAAVLVFPLLYTCACNVFTMLGLGDNSNPGAAIAYFPALRQNASVALAHGLCFGLMLVSSLFAMSVDAKKKIKRTGFAVAGGLIIVFSLIFGICRLNSKAEPDKYLTVSMCTSFDQDYTAISSIYSEEEYLELLDRQLSESVERGAQLALFSEEHTCIREENLDETLGQISEMIKDYGIPVVLSFEITTHEGEKDINGFIFFNSDGEQILKHEKNNLVPIIEAPYYAKGSEKIAETSIDIDGCEYKIAVSICFDLNDAAFIRGMDKDTEILIGTCWEWDTANAEQKRSAVLRAVENEVTVIKPTQDGYNCVVNPYGEFTHIESSKGKYESVDIAEVPVYLKENRTAGISFEPISAMEAVSIFMLIILFLAMLVQLKSSDAKSRAYINCLAITVFGLLFDACSYIFDGAFQNDMLCLEVNLFSYIFTDIIMIAFAVYLDKLLSERREKENRWIKIVCIIPVADIIFLIIACAIGKLFFVKDGAYIPGPWDIYSGIVPIVAMICIMVGTIVNRKYLQSRELIALMLYLLLPIAAAVLVSSFGSNGSYSYVAVSLSLLVVYALIQANTIEIGKIREQLFMELSTIDTLTGLNNRRAYEQKLAPIEAGTPMTAIFCDLNKLKETNDAFGHETGDKLIVYFSEMLLKFFNKDDVFRISGDEFVVILTGKEDHELADVLSEFRLKVIEEDDISAVGCFSGNGEKPYLIVAEAERLMYEDKVRCHSKNKSE